jgi:hypothetical protein
MFVAGRGSQQTFEKSKSCFINVKHVSGGRTLRNIVEVFEDTVFTVRVTRDSERLVQRDFIHESDISIHRD